MFFLKSSEEQEEYCNFEMITALSACVGVTIRVSWCRRHRLVGKWWFRAAAWLRLGTVSQQFPEHSVVLVWGSGCLDSHHTLMSASARTVCLFKHLRNINVSFNERLFFFFLLLPSESTSRISVRFLELCTRASIIRAYSGPGRRLGATGFKWRGRRHTCGPVCDSAMLPAWWRLFMPRVAAAAGNLSVAFVSTCVIPGPCIIYAAPQMRAFSG